LNYEIIQLKPENYNQCSNIWDMTKQPDSAKWYQELVSGNRLIFVYTINGEFIGEGALVFDNGDPDYTISGQRIYLSRMIVKKEYRHQGIGQTLLDYLCKQAKNLGYSEISLGVDTENLVARHLYEKNGFTTVIYQGSDQHGNYVKLLKPL
jgi:ribosomal protein S18 acetylase RimI-like enzyme